MTEASLSKSGLLRKEKVTIIAFYAIMTIIIAFGLIASTLIGQSYLVLAGLGLVAFILGLQHGVDADHIAAIDNTTRKLLQEGKRPLTVGMWFSPRSFHARSDTNCCSRNRNQGSRSFLVICNLTRNKLTYSQTAQQLQI
jgi:High-affinity nickel-transport protein